jgi:hypothetical protein
MNEVTRREALKVVSATGVIGGLIVARSATAADEKDEDKSVETSSGTTRLQPPVKELKPKVAVRLTRGAAGLVPLTPDADPGWNVAIISVPEASAASAWATELTADGKSHAGGAYFNTHSVQLFDGGKQLRVRFYMEWGNHLPSALQVIVF